jgi:hypothetical protein
MMNGRVVIQSPFYPQWNGETGTITDVRNGTYRDGTPYTLARIKLDRIAASVEFTLEELADL